MNYAKDSIDLLKGFSPQRRRKVAKQTDSDTDFQARNDSDADDSEGDTTEEVTPAELDSKENERASRSLHGPQPIQGMQVHKRSQG